MVMEKICAEIAEFNILDRLCKRPLKYCIWKTSESRA